MVMLGEVCWDVVAKMELGVPEVGWAEGGGSRRDRESPQRVGEVPPQGEEREPPDCLAGLTSPPALWELWSRDPSYHPPPPLGRKGWALVPPPCQPTPFLRVQRQFLASREMQPCASKTHM